MSDKELFVSYMWRNNFHANVENTTLEDPSGPITMKTIKILEDNLAERHPQSTIKILCCQLISK